MDRIEQLRQAMLKREEELRTKAQNVLFAVERLPFPATGKAISAQDADVRELDAYRAFFDSFATDPIRL